MKTPSPWILPLCVLLLGGCADGSLAKRDDSRYVVLPVNSASGVASPTPDVHKVVPLGASGSQIDPQTKTAVTVAAESPRERKQREEQDKLESDLAKLDGK